jgi:RNA polymerase sigma-70 factor (ECF subfamily)
LINEERRFLDSENDTQLLERVARGDKNAMQVLYLRHHDALYGFVLGRGSDADTAKDVLHDAMLEVWRSAGKFRGASSVRTWIFTIARNKYVDRIRGGARLTFMEEVPETRDDTPDAETVIAASQDANRVQRCLGRLSDMQQTVIRLSFYDGLSYTEIAEIEDVPIGTIKSRVFHAKQMLMHCLGVPQ